jgi:hypothetical protein
LSVTIQYPRGGGLVVVYADSFRGVPLDRVMLHELGHVLGLPRNGGSYLMSPNYSPSDYACIDRATVEAVAALRNLPLNELNWCIY